MSTDQRRSIWIASVALLSYFGVVLIQAALTNVIDQGQWRFFNYSVLWVLRGAGIAAGTWFALGNGRWFVRGASCLVLLIWTWIAWQAGVLIITYRPVASLSWQYIFSGSALFFASAGLLAIARVLGGMSLDRVSNESSIFELPRRFTLKQSLIFVTAVAATLAAARVVVPPQMGSWEWPSMVRQQMQANWLGLFLHATLWCIVIIPTTTLVVFRPRWLLVTALYFACTCFAGLIIERWYSGGLSGVMQSPKFLWIDTISQAGALLWHVVALFVTLRLLGYRLQWTGPPRIWRTSTPATSAA